MLDSYPVVYVGLLCFRCPMFYMTRLCKELIACIGETGVLVFAVGGGFIFWSKRQVVLDVIALFLSSPHAPLTVDAISKGCSLQHMSEWDQLARHIPGQHQCCRKCHRP